MAIIQSTPPPLDGVPVQALNKKDFDATLWNRSYRAFIDKAMRCPCRNVPDAQAQSNCKNCGGSGYFFINRTVTRILIQSQNLDTKFKEWSEERLGTVKISARQEEGLSYMDRVTLPDTTSIFSEVMHPVRHTDTIIRSMTTYDVENVLFLYAFIDSTTKLTVLTEGVDYTIVNKKWFVFTNIIALNSVSIRYKHNPAYHILDMPRNVMQNDDVKGAVQNFPVSAIGRLAHYSLSIENLAQDYLFNNDNVDPCETLVDEC